MTHRSNPDVHVDRTDYPLITKVAETHPVAAKDYICTICGQVIPKGERHERLVYRDDDSLDPSKALKFLRIHHRCPPLECTTESEQ